MLRRLSSCSAVVLGSLFLAAVPATAQVKVSLARKAFLDPLPFRSGFTVRGKLPDSANKVVIAYRPMPSDTVMAAVWDRPPVGYDVADTFTVRLKPLLPDHEYTFCVGVYGPDSLQVPLPTAEDEKCPGELMQRLTRGDPPRYVVKIKGTARSSWKNHFDADLGAMYGTATEYYGLVTSAHMQFLPFNKSVDLMDHGNGFIQQMATRLSIFVGLSPVEIHAGAEQPIKKTPLGIPVVGVGFRGFFYWKNTGGFYSRFIQPIRLNAGVMFFEQDDPNPLVDKDDAKKDFFISLTADIEVNDVLGPLAGLFGLK